MDIFPTNVTPKNVTPVDSLSPSPRINKSMVKEPETAQLTLFYNGEVIVLDDFPAEKVEELKSFASTQTRPSVIPDRVLQPPPPTLTDMVIARKTSLLRFMEKRNVRVSAKSPYQRIDFDSAPKKNLLNPLNDLF